MDDYPNETEHKAWIEEYQDNINEAIEVREKLINKFHEIQSIISPIIDYDLRRSMHPCVEMVQSHLTAVLNTEIETMHRYIKELTDASQR